jgi:phosphoribosyl 1,2-cyclic phosphodiesterase
MEFTVLGSGSHGNCYILTSENGDQLIIEAGIKLSRVKKFLDFNLNNVLGVLVSHSHLDHAKAMKEMTESGINVYASSHTIEGMDIKSHRVKKIEAKKAYKIGPWKVIPIEMKHDVPCFGFVLNHEECGNVVFITDTYYSPFKFKNINNWIVEANYSEEILDGKEGYGNQNDFLRNRVLSSHLSIENCWDLLKKNDLTQTNNIVLTHLSDTNSHAENFKRMTKEKTGKSVHIAETGLNINFDKRPF